MAADLPTVLKVLARSTLVTSSLLSREELVAILPMRIAVAEAWLDARIEPAFTEPDSLYRWGDVARVLHDGTDLEPSEVRSEPITTWRAVAAALGVSEDTVARHRRRHGVVAGQELSHLVA